MTRAVLTGEVLRSQNPVPWAGPMMRQLDPSDPAFLPTMMGIHPVLAARDLTLVGVPGRRGVAWIDPIGWCGVGDGPSVCVWFGEGREGVVVGRQPGGPKDEATAVEQRRGEDGLSVVTTAVKGPLTLALHHWPVVLQGEVAWVIYAKLALSGPAPRPVRLAFSIRPVCVEGVAPIFELGRDSEGLWTADGVPVMAMSTAGDEIIEGSHGRPDPFHRFTGQVHSGPSLSPGPLHVRCTAGQATGTEVFRATLSPDEPMSRFVVYRPPEATPATLVRTTAQSLWAGALADRRGVLAAGATLTLERHHALFIAARQRVLLETGEGGLAGFLGALALGRLGFVRRAGARLGGWMNQVKRDGQLPGMDPASAAVLAWASAEFIRWTQDSGFREEHRLAWRRLLDRLASDPGAPGGQLFFGADGSGRWTSMWRAAALLASAVQLRETDDGHKQWAMIGGQAREALANMLGDAPWSVAPGRRPDGSAAAMLAVAWMGLFDARQPGVLQTLDHVRRHFWFGGGVLLNGGAHPALTALLSVVEERARPAKAPDPIDVMAGLASPTGAFPTAYHPARGALQDGDDLLSAAMFVLVALDRVRASRTGLTILPDLVGASDLPTPFGRMTLESGEVRGQWVGPTPTINVTAGETRG